MDTLVFIIVIIAALFAIASGLWVAIALGNAISKNKRENTQKESVRDLNAE